MARLQQDHSTDIHFTKYTLSKFVSCAVRPDAKMGELISDFIVEGKENKKIATDFFVVRVNDTAPKKHQKMFIHADFPRENRQTHPQRRDDLKKYFKKISNSEPSWSRFADFHLILYIAQEIDVDTALTICESVRDRKEIPEGVLMIIN